MPDETEPDESEPNETEASETATDATEVGDSETGTIGERPPKLPPPTGERLDVTGRNVYRARPKAPEPASGWRRRFTWTRVIVWGWVAVFVVLFVRWVYPPYDVDEGFIRFQPDESLFPAAPVADAETMVGIGIPDSWTTGGDYCPYTVYLDPSYGFSTARGREWHNVRHDWEADGEAKAWIISETTFAFDDKKEGEKYIDGLRDRFTYCGWEYDDEWRGGRYNTIITEMDGLPDDSFAFVVDASPTSDRDPAEFGFSDPDDFTGLGVVMPGDKPGHMVFVTWTGWATDVPRDEFIATANRIYDAANQAPDPDDVFKKDETTIDFADGFEEFRPDESSVMSLIGGGEEDWPIKLDSSDCELSFSSANRGYLSRDRNYSRDTYVVSSSERWVEFTSAGFTERWRYLSAKDRMSQVVTPLCMTTLQQPKLLIEPIPVPDGLPDGTTAAVWYGEDADDTYVGDDTYAVLLTDDERQLIMVIAWTEFDNELSEPLFVEAINTAWTEFRTANRR